VKKKEEDRRMPGGQEVVMEDHKGEERDDDLGLDKEADFLVDAAWRQVRSTAWCWRQS